MYRKSSYGWFKHIDFLVLDLICVQIAFFVSYVLFQNDLNPYGDLMYRNMAIFMELADVMIVFFFESFKNVLKRGYYKEFVVAVKQAVMLLLLCSLYLINGQIGADYSRGVLYLTAILYGGLSYIVRVLWKRFLHKRMEAGGDRSLIIVTTSRIATEVIENVVNNNYEMFRFSGIIIIDKDMTGSKICGIPVVADGANAAEYLCQGWVDEVFFNVEELHPYPKALIDRCTEMGLTVHLNLAKVSDGMGSRQMIEKVGRYTVLTCSINTMSIRQAFVKRTMDILFGLAGCIATGIIFVFIAPVIYISSPGPIFFSQERVGQNGKTFKMYKFRSMYMDAEERKAELMKENKMGSSLMFKMDFDPRIIGNKVLPDGRKKTGVGQFIRATSLDEFPQFFNVLMGSMSTVGEWDIIGTTRENSTIYAACVA